ncbi:hypothetical protein BN938_2283 [Mucinivorans hirudinis]|uniref:DUF1643 domain-containing protein n=1 Tax=Mucinivorans hirudinis TaxID=1433126 RepID=A0A060R9S9_9BACT|nr:hypothetical protein BN938_2283 [Mucinivorans hirudinis]
MKEKIREVIDKFKTQNQQETEIIQVLNRGVFYVKNNPEEEILVVGINPSYNTKEASSNEKICSSLKDTNESTPYWKRTKQMLGNFLPKAAYLDLFPLFFSKQEDFERLFQTNLPLMGQLLAITQEEIERLAPRLIIVQNKRAQCYWGRNKNSVWMGYEFEKIDNLTIKDKELDVCRIVGLKNDPQDERVFKLNSTNLVGTVIVFYGLYDDRHKVTCANRIIESKDIKKLYEYATDTAPK